MVGGWMKLSLSLARVRGNETTPKDLCHLWYSVTKKTTLDYLYQRPFLIGAPQSNTTPDDMRDALKILSCSGSLVYVLR